MTIIQSHIFQIIQKEVLITIDRLAGIAQATDDPTVVAQLANSPTNSLQDLVAASKAASSVGPRPTPVRMSIRKSVRCVADLRSTTPESVRRPIFSSRSEPAPPVPRRSLQSRT